MRRRSALAVGCRATGARAPSRSLLAHDARAWRDAVSRGDAAFAQTRPPAGRRARGCPGDPVRRLLGVANEVRAAARGRGVRRRRRRRPRASTTASTAPASAPRPRWHSPTVAADGSPTQSAQANDLLGVLALVGPRGDGAANDARSQPSRRPSGWIRANADAKYNLELVLRRAMADRRAGGHRQRAAGPRGGPAPGAGVGHPGERLLTCDARAALPQPRRRARRLVGARPAAARRSRPAAGARVAARCSGCARTRPPAARCGPSRLAAVCALLGLAAAQPVLRLDRATARARRRAGGLRRRRLALDARVRAAPEAPTRLDGRARVALRLRDAIPEVPAGHRRPHRPRAAVRLPDGRPARLRVDARARSRSSRRRRRRSTVATTFAALTALARGGFFATRQPPGVCVVVTDGESRPVDAGAARGARRAGCRLIVVRVGGAAERVYGADGRSPSPATGRPPSGARLVARLAAAVGGHVLGAARAPPPTPAQARGLAGRGPARARAPRPRVRRARSPWRRSRSLRSALAALGAARPARPRRVRLAA